MADDGWYHYPTDAELSAAIDRNLEDGTYVLIDEGVWAWFGDQADAEAAAASGADTSSLDEIAENYGANAARAAAALRAADGSDLSCFAVLRVLPGLQVVATRRGCPGP